MSILFTPMKIGKLELPNRFVCSATHEAMAGRNGEVSEELIKRYERLGRGNVGLIITGLMHVHPSGRSYERQTGIDHDSQIGGLAQLAGAVHKAGGRIAFQLAHGGRQTTKKMAGRTPLAPSSRGRDPLNFVKPKEMSEDEIAEIIRAFGAAAARAAEAGADCIQLHGAHGYLISEFLSPYFNVRKDSWGGSDENRFRFLKEVFREVRNKVPPDMPVLVKLNAEDHTPKEGISPPLAARYAGWLSELGTDGVEVSCGTTHYSFMNMCRGDVPKPELIKSLSWWEKPFGALMMGKLEGRYDLQEGYNLEAAKRIRPALGSTPLILVGGMRAVSRMEEVLEKKQADLISMARPFIREPFLVNMIREGRMERVACVSCNRCLAAVPNGIPVYCYNKGFPRKNSQ